MLHRRLVTAVHCPVPPPSVARRVHFASVPLREANKHLWATHWEGRDIDKALSFLDPDFVKAATDEELDDRMAAAKLPTALTSFLKRHIPSIRLLDNGKNNLPKTAFGSPHVRNENLDRRP